MKTTSDGGQNKIWQTKILSPQNFARSLKTIISSKKRISLTYEGGIRGKLGGNYECGSAQPSLFINLIKIVDILFRIMKIETCFSSPERSSQGVLTWFRMSFFTFCICTLCSSQMYSFFRIYVYTGKILPFNNNIC